MEVGRKRYDEHYGELERLLKAEGREYLDWTVEDGWGPLCAFLEQKVPESEFPSGNDTKALAAMRARMHKRGNKRIMRNVMIKSVVLVAGVALLVKYVLSRA